MTIFASSFEKFLQKFLDRQVFPDSFKFAKIKPLSKEVNDLQTNFSFTSCG